MKFMTLLILFTQVAWAQIHLVSDLDDTIKITNVGDISDAIRNGIFSKKAFDGVPMAVKEMRTYIDSFTVVSASPRQLTPRIRSFLAYHNIIPDDLYTRNIFRDSDTTIYKTRVIEDILAKRKGKLILMGDDTEHDPDIFLDIKSRFPNRILAVYIHAVNNKKLPENFHKYFTGMEIARGEVLAKRMGLIEAYSVMNSIQVGRRSYIFPDFAYCPESIEEFGEIKLSHMQHSLEQTYYPLTEYCASRNFYLELE